MTKKQEHQFSTSMSVNREEEQQKKRPEVWHISPEDNNVSGGRMEEVVEDGVGDEFSVEHMAQFPHEQQVGRKEEELVMVVDEAPANEMTHEAEAEEEGGEVEEVEIIDKFGKDGDTTTTCSLSLSQGSATPPPLPTISSPNGQKEEEEETQSESQEQQKRQLYHSSSISSEISALSTTSSPNISTASSSTRKSPSMRLIEVWNSDPSNKICADCRVPLVERAKTYASFRSDVSFSALWGVGGPLLRHLASEDAATAGTAGGMHGANNIGAYMRKSGGGRRKKKGRARGSGGSVTSFASAKTVKQGNRSAKHGSSSAAKANKKPNQQTPAHEPSAQEQLRNEVGASKTMAKTSDNVSANANGNGTPIMGPQKSMSTGALDLLMDKMQDDEKQQQHQQQSQTQLTNGTVETPPTQPMQRRHSNQDNYVDFRSTHAALAPPSLNGTHTPTPNDTTTSNTPPKPEKSDQEKHNTLLNRSCQRAIALSSHGVFLCHLCAAAHRTLGPTLTTVKCITDSSPKEATVRPEDVAIMSAAGGNARSKLALEKYMNKEWKRRIPRYDATMEERVVFARAKYEVYAFAFPGFVGGRSEWLKVLGRENVLKAIAMDGSLFDGKHREEKSGSRSRREGSLSSSASSTSSGKRGGKMNPSAPPRLVEHFCVIEPSWKLTTIPSGKKQQQQRPSTASSSDDVSTTSSVQSEMFTPPKSDASLAVEEASFHLASDPEKISLEAQVVSCYPPPPSSSSAGTSSDSTTTLPQTPLPKHLPQMVFPNGCHPSVTELPPVFFPFVLTLESGLKLYGAALRLYDEAIRSEDVLVKVREAYNPTPKPSSDQQSTSTPKRSRRGRRSSNSSGSSQSRSSSRNRGRPPTPPLPGTASSSYSYDYDSTLSNTTATPMSEHSPLIQESFSAEMLLVPKCLVLLSHYPFHEVWRQFLQQLYRISLVEAPLPMERYIANFCGEVPLPPRGKVEIRWSWTTMSAPDDVCFSISRPPKNHFPLACFSFRPLFTALSVSNIMTVVGCLLQEDKVVLCAQHTAILTSGSEALLNLIFPFVWQGLYIPVMPYNMIDILDAPVPFLVGLHSHYLTEYRPQYRPHSVVFVDLDNDVVHLGFEESKHSTNGDDDDEEDYGRPVPQLPEKDAAKLKTALEEHGGVAYLSTSSGRKGRVTFGFEEDMDNSLREQFAQETAVVWSSSNKKAQQALSGLVRASVMSKVDRAYPNEEHLIPIRGFVTNRGTILERDLVAAAHGKRRGMGGIRFPRKKPPRPPPKVEDQVESSSRGSQLNTKSLLDPTADEAHGFSAGQIRNSFLRFFVSMLRNYDKFVKTLEDDEIFGIEEFLRKADHINAASKAGFVRNFLSSQMFQRFIEERLRNPNQHEIKFFDESIIAKKNRSSKSALRKKETPFLSDTSGAIKDIYTPPPPSNWGLPDDDRVYHYGHFPRLNVKLFGKTRSPEIWKDDSTDRYVATTDLVEHKLFSNLFGNEPVESQTPERDVVWAIHVMAYQSLQSAASEDVVGGEREKAKKEGEEQNEHDLSSSAIAKDVVPVAAGLMSSVRRKQGRMLSLITKSQATYRMHCARENYLTLRLSAICLQRCTRKLFLRQNYGKGRTRLFVKASDIQRIFRGNMVRTMEAERKRGAIMIQRSTRRWLVSRHMNKLKSWVLMVQSILRGRKARFAYRLVLDLVAVAQACLRGFLVRSAVKDLVKHRISLYRTQMFELWRRACTPLSYRAKFWTFVNGSDCLHLAIHEDELVKLWRELGLKSLVFQSTATKPDKLDKEREMNGDDESPSSKSTKEMVTDMLGCKSVAVYKRYLVVKRKLKKVKVKDSTKLVPVFPCEIGAIRPFERKKFNIGSRKEAMRVSFKQLSVERAEMYEKLKYAADKSTLEGVYQSFDIPASSKRKKEKVIELLWEHDGYIEQSYQVVLLNEGLSHSAYKRSKRARKIFEVGNEISDPISRAIEEHSTKSVQTKLHKRIDGYVHNTVQLLFQALIALLPPEEQASRQKQAVAAGFVSSSWLDTRAVIIAEYLSCGWGENSAFREFAWKRLERNTKVSNAERHAEVEGESRASNYRNGIMSWDDVGRSDTSDPTESVVDSSEQDTAGDSVASSPKPSRRSSGESDKRTDFHQAAQRSYNDSFDRLILESSHNLSRFSK